MYPRGGDGMPAKRGWCILMIYGKPSRRRERSLVGGLRDILFS